MWVSVCVYCLPAQHLAPQYKKQIQTENYGYLEHTLSSFTKNKNDN